MKSLITCVVAGLQYLIHPQKLGSIQETINPDAIVPVTLLATNEIFNDVDAILRLFDVVDDVFVPAFGSVLVEKPGGNETDFSSLLGSGLVDIYHLSEVETMASDIAELPSGPYFLHGPNLHQAWRLYDDDFGAFTFGVIPEDVDEPDEYRALNGLSVSGLFKAIPVPSRLYHPPPSRKKPLSGLRISITDVFSLKGVQTTFSSKAWTLLYNSTASTTATYAQKLIDFGAVIVGKTKAAQFGVGEQWVDDHAPSSPRADGYQKASGSSVGAESSLSGYDWLNYAVGRNDFVPNLQDIGLYSISLSPGIVSQHGIINTSRYDDMRLFGRNLDELIHLTLASIDGDSSPTKRPTRLIYPVDLEPNATDVEKRLLNEFITALEMFLGIKTERLSLADLWDQTPPSGSDGQGMQTYMSEAPFLSWCHGFYHAFDTFREDYQKAFDKEPYVETAPAYYWDVGKKVTKAEQGQFLERVRTYRQWLDENVMQINQPTSAAVMILPCEPSEPRYRDEPAGWAPHETVVDTANVCRTPKPIEGLSAALLALMLNVPRLTVPFAQLPFESAISRRTEYQPVCAALVGGHGRDLSLLQLAKGALELAQWRTRVDTGQLAFPLADNPRNVDDRRYAASGLQHQL